MTKLLELTKGFSVSRPVFHLQLSRDGRDIIVKDPLYKYVPVPSIEGDLLSEMICANYREHFCITEGVFKFEETRIAGEVLSCIRGDICRFVEKNLKMKSPRQSKLYRWTYRSMENTTEINDVLVMVYKYLRSFTDVKMRATDTNHINNGIALLEAIMEKYER